MTDLARLIAEHDCRQLMLKYCEYVDTRQIGPLVALFASDGVLARPDTGEMKGHSAIEAFFDTLPTDPLIHSASNLLVTVKGPESAGATSYVTVYRSHGTNRAGLPKLVPAYLVAKYVDTFVVENGEWRIGYRDTIFAAKE